MTMNSTTLKFAGDVSFNELQIVSLNGQSANILSQVMAIEVYEDLFSSFTTLNVTLRESVDYINLFPFVGEEYLDIDIDTPTMNSPIKGRFYIYKITDRQHTSDREVVYCIMCVSIEFLNDANIKISKAIGGNIAESAAMLLGKDGLNTKKKINIEKTSNTTKFVSNFWSPVKCLNYLTTMAISSMDSPSYLFYENRDGFNFRSINDLLQLSSKHTFVKDNYVRTMQNSNTNSSIMDPTEDYKRVLDIRIPVLTDYMSNIQSGQIKSRMITHDILTKKYTLKDYSLKKDGKPHNLLNQNPGYSKYSISNAASTMVVVPKYYNSFTNYTDTSTAKTTQKRMSFFENLQKFKLSIDVIGRTDYTVGQVVQLTVPRVTQITKTDTDTNDPILSGRYLISAICHTINRETHSCTIELIKNSSLTNLSK